MSDLPEGVDSRLWILWGDPAERLYLYANPHTFPGRMEAYRPDGSSLSVSKYEIQEASDLSWVWIDGFLSGNEPTPPDDEDEAAYSAWQQAMKLFRESGDLTR